MGLFKKSAETDPPDPPIDIPYAVEIDRLLVEIDPEAPSGADDLSGDPAFVDLEIKIQGTPEREFGGKIVQEAKPPNWPTIQSAAVTLLARAHDLRVAMFLVRALLHNRGLIGLYTGLDLLDGYVDGYWDTLHPQLDPADNDDPTERINILWALSEGPDILDPLKQAGLFSPQPTVQVALRDIHIASGTIAVKDEVKRSTLSLEMIEKALKDCDEAALRTTREVIGRCVASLERLEQRVEEKVGADRAPDFKKLKTVLGEMAAFFDKHLPPRPPSGPTQRKDQPAAEHSAVEQAAAPPAGEPADGGSAMESISNRKEVIRLLDQICAYYEQYEPASPVPLLLKRARQLVEKNFVEIVADLAPQAADQLKSLFGDYPPEGS